MRKVTSLHSTLRGPQQTPRSVFGDELDCSLNIIIKHEARPAEARPAEARPAEARPAEARPAEARPEGSRNKNKFKLL